MKLFPGITKYEEASLNDYTITKLANFFSTANYKQLRLRMLYAAPIINNGVLSNPQADFGQVVGQDQNFTSVYNIDLADKSLLMEQIKATSTAGAIRAGTIQALVLVDQSAITKPLIVYKLKRPIVVTSNTVLATQTGKLNHYDQPHPFKFKKYNSQFNKDERFYGFLTINRDLLPGETIIGKIKGTAPLTEAAEWDYVTKLLLDLKNLQVPFNPIGSVFDKVIGKFDSDLSYTSASKTYQLIADFTIPRDLAVAPTAMMFKPKTSSGFDEDLTFVLFKFDGFGRGGNFTISTSVTME